VTTDSVVACRGVSKRFAREQSLRNMFRRRGEGDWTHALRSVDLLLAPGETLGLVGRNGAGKSTLLKMIAGLIEADSGSIAIGGADPVADPMAARRDMGFVLSNERSFFWRISVEENLRFFARLQQIPHGDIAEECVYLLDAVGLANSAKRIYKDLSEGLRQRLAIARGLLGDPALLLMDEATLHLDPGSRTQLTPLFRSRRNGDPRSLLMVSHDLEEVQQVCDRLVCLENGAVWRDGPLASEIDIVRTHLHQPAGGGS